ncbi:MAG: DUF2796 domain-containing protein [Marinobacter sp.]|nr:DUF2796 domain-containing protein [Marinobacter sp.]
MASPKMTTAILTVTILTAGSALASDNPGAHRHGQAELQLAIAENQIELFFTSPAYNLLGFEHRATTEEEKALVTETTGWLSKTALVDTAEDSCTVVNSTVNHQADGNDHSHDHKDESSHSDFEITQMLSCSGLDASEAFSTPLTARFPEIEHLNVEWVWSGGQGSVRLEHGDTSFRLSAQ